MAELGVVSVGANAGLLDYSLTTSPAPLQASPASGDAAIGSIDIAVSNGGDDPIYCDSIRITLPVGDLAQDLTNDPKSLRVAASPSGKWTLASTKVEGVLMATPNKPEYAEITTDGIFFQIYNIHVNRQVGTFELHLVESAHKGTDPDVKRDNAYKLPKFPYGFSVSNFRASATEVQDGQPVILSWEGSEGATYTLTYGESPPVDVTGLFSWPKPPGLALHGDTTFMLDASAQVEGQTVHVYQSVTVTVADPEIVATSLTVNQASALLGPTTVGTTQAPQPLTVNGPTTLTDLTVDTTATVTHGLAASGALSVGGPVQAFSAAQPVQPGSYPAATTDGWVIGEIDPFEGPWKTFPLWGILVATCGATTACATGGMIAIPSNGGYIGNYPLAGSLALPVPQGATWTICSYYANYPGWPSLASAYFWWVPLGVGVTAAPKPIGPPPEPPSAITDHFDQAH
jgi:hypothetical protein